jgi:filamin
MDLAKQHFSIPMILQPDNLSSPELDEMSAMTYLSYFMKVDSPGYNATLRWVQQQVPQERVQNFQVIRKLLPEID